LIRPYLQCTPSLSLSLLYTHTHPHTCTHIQSCGDSAISPSELCKPNSHPEPKSKQEKWWGQPHNIGLLPQQCTTRFWNSQLNIIKSQHTYCMWDNVHLLVFNTQCSLALIFVPLVRSPLAFSRSQSASDHSLYLKDSLSIFESDLHGGLGEYVLYLKVEEDCLTTWSYKRKLGAGNKKSIKDRASDKHSKQHVVFGDQSHTESEGAVWWRFRDGSSVCFYKFMRL